MADDPKALAEALVRLQAASEAASQGTAYTAGPPWFRTGDGVLVGSPDPHAGRLIADTDTSGFDDDHDGSDDEPNAVFFAEAWNFARLVLSDPTLLAALRASDGAGAVQEPPPGLLMSMAVRYDHGLGMPGYYDQEIFKLAGQSATHADRLRATLSTMRQLWEETAGKGFYRPRKEAEYVAMRDRALGSGALPLSDGGGHGA